MIFRRILIPTILLCVLPLSERAVAETETNIDVEICFTLDTTGSMSGLIDGAKRKIWSIANDIASLSPRPNIKFCLLAYRDQGDAYVTKMHDLNADIDVIYQTLQSYQANGGGDQPESVNQALYETVNDVSWSKEKDTLRIVYLVGDAPPHMDYPEEIKYPATVKMAKQADIVINTIQCGNISATTPIWKDIARDSDGYFAKLPQSGNMTVIETPFDQDFKALNSKMGKTMLPYGSHTQRDKIKEVQTKTQGFSSATIADRLSYNTKTNKIIQRQGDLIDDLTGGGVNLEDIPESHLPSELRGLSKEEKLAYIEQIKSERAEYQRIIRGLDEERREYLKEKVNGQDSSFDQEVIDRVIDIAKRKGIEFKN